MDLERRHLDKNRGIQSDAFEAALEKAAAKNVNVSVNPPTKDIWPRTSTQDDTGDPYDSTYVKLKDTKFWNRHPASPAEEAIYFGVHMHTESNPFGLHSHMPGGKASGAHSHGPQNRMGDHHHRTDAPKMVQVDGSHEHHGNHPNGEHDHHPANFG